MSFKNKLRRYWHDLYYFLASDEAAEFAMRCQHVAEIVDLENKQASLKDRFRFYLHLSLCQACANYSKISRVLKRAILKVISQPRVTQIVQLNQRLIAKHADQEK